MIFPRCETVAVMLPLVILALCLDNLIFGVRVGKLEDKAQSSVGIEACLVALIRKALCPHGCIQRM